MNPFLLPLQVRWSDLDPNFHLRHSVYYDWGALCRIDFFYQYGLTDEVFRVLQFGPIILREECVFRKEIRPADKVSMNLVLAKAKEDYSRWTIQHTIFKNDSIVSAILTIDGAWIDTAKRKLLIPPPQAVEVFKKMPTGKEFQWI